MILIRSPQQSISPMMEGTGNNQPAREMKSETQKEKVSDDQVREWAERYDLFWSTPWTMLRMMVDDARSLHLLEKNPTPQNGDED